MKLAKGTFGIFPAAQCSGKDHYLQQVFIWLCFHANNDGICFPSINKLAQESNISKSTIIRKLRELEKIGFIKKTNRHIEKGYTSNLYEIHIVEKEGSVRETPPSVRETLGVVSGRHQGVVSGRHPNQTSIFNQTHINQKKVCEFTIEFEEFWKCYPQREGNIDKRGAFSQWKARLKEGHTADEMIAGAKRYHTHSKAKGHIGTSYVKMAKTFLGQGKHFLEQWKTFDFPTFDDAFVTAKQPDAPPIIKQMLALCGDSFDRQRLTETEFRYRFTSAYKTIKAKMLSENCNDH